MAKTPFFLDYMVWLFLCDWVHAVYMSSVEIYLNLVLLQFLSTWEILIPKIRFLNNSIPGVSVHGLYNSGWFCAHKLSMFIYLSMAVTQYINLLTQFFGRLALHFLISILNFNYRFSNRHFLLKKNPFFRRFCLFVYFQNN